MKLARVIRLDESDLNIFGLFQWLAGSDELWPVHLCGRRPNHRDGI